MGVAGGYPPVLPPPTPPLEEAPPAPAPDLQKHFGSRRTLTNAIFSVVIAIMALIALAPLISVLGMLFFEGGKRLGPALFTELPPAAKMPGGGIGNAVLGTLLMVGI